MVDLDGISAAALRAELEQVEAKTPALRLVVAINHQHGLTQTAIAEQYGLARKTVYNWLTRFETDPVHEAIYDDARPGRPPKLPDARRDEFHAVLREPPREAGYDADAWTPRLVEQLLEDRFEVDYSRPHVRRLMHDAGLEYVGDGWRVEA